MPADLPHGERVALEQAGRARPVIEQAPDPGQADQADAELDAAGPVRAGQKRVLPPPGAQLISDPAGVSLVLGEEPGGGQQCEVLQPGQPVKVQVLKIDRDRRKVSLGLRQLTASPWETLLERYYVGSVQWQPGELSQELRRHLWDVLEADPSLVFSADPEHLWSRLSQQARGTMAVAATLP